MQKCKIIFLNAAKKDIKEASKYYRQISTDLSVRFKTELKLQIDKLTTWPEIRGKRYGDIRMANLKIFPYAIHYFYNEEKNTIFIVGVFSHYLSPDKWLERNSE